MPRAEIDDLADTIIREPFENIDFDILGELNENDSNMAWQCTY